MIKLFSEKVEPTFTNSDRNILQVENFEEVFFDVYEFEINGNKYPVEKISEHKGNPVVSVPVEVKGKVSSYPFVLIKGKPEVIFNESSSGIEYFGEVSEVESEDDIEIFLPEEEELEDIPLLEDKREEILQEIKNAKREALRAAKQEIESIKEIRLQHVEEEAARKEKALTEYLESARANLVSEFMSISNKIRDELSANNNEEFVKIDESVDEKISSIADNLSKSIKKDFTTSAKQFDKSIKELVQELYTSEITPKVDKELELLTSGIDTKVSAIEDNINIKISSIETTLNEKLSNKVDDLVIQDINKEVHSLRDTNIELNNSLNKGVQKALSRIGNVDKKVDSLSVDVYEAIDNKIADVDITIRDHYDSKIESIREQTSDIVDSVEGRIADVKLTAEVYCNDKLNDLEKRTFDITEAIEDKIAEVETNVRDYYDDKLKVLEEKTFDINEESRKYFVDLIQESRDNLINEIRQIKNEKPVEYIIEANGSRQVKDFDSFRKDFDKQISEKINTEIANLKKYISMYSSGGGSVAVQFADGGIMNGDLTVNGNTTFNGNNTIDGNSSITGDVSIEGAITSIDSIQFDKAAGITVEQGELAWNAEDLTLDLGLDTNVTLQLGQEQVIRVKCADPLGVFDGMPVYAYGTTGGSDNIEIKRYSSAAGYGVDELYFIGVATEDIAFNGVGFVTTFGRVREVDGRAYGTNNGVKDPADSGNWVFGDVLYVSPNIAGTLTRIIPESPDARIPVAMVLKAPNQSNITLMVRAEHGYHLTELHDVYARTPNNGDVLAYNASNSRWENTSNISVSSLSATTIHALSSFVEVIDIKQYELSGFNVTGNATVQGSISATGDLTVDTDTLYVDSVDSRVGIGTTDPSAKLHIGLSNDSTQLLINTSGSQDPLVIEASGVNKQSYINLRTSGSAGELYNGWISGRVGGGVQVNRTFRVSDGNSGPQTGNVTLEVNSSGRVGIGTTSPSAKLHTLATTEQLRLGYDTSNYWNATTDSAGTTIFNGAGTNSRFKFTQNILAPLTIDRDDLGSHANKPILTIENTGTGAFAHRASLQFKTKDAGGTTQTAELQSSGGTLAVSLPTNASFDVTGSSNNTTFGGSTPALKIHNSDPTNNNYAGLLFGTGSTRAGIVSQNVVTASNYADLLFTTRGASGYLERMRIDNNGNVGIGISSPSAKLHVAGDTLITGDLTVDTDTLYVDSADSRVGIGTTNPLAKLEIIGDNFTSATYAQNTKNSQLSSYFRLRDDGKVFVGPSDVVNSVSILNVNGEIYSSSNVVCTSLYANSFASRASNNLRLQTYNSPYVYITRDTINSQDLNFGIGTTTPEARLHTVGDAIITGDLTVDTDTLYVDSTDSRVGIGTTNPLAKLHVSGNTQVDGHFSATTKSFLIDNPNGGKLQYGVVESNEHGVYVRGKTSDSTITLPEHWEWLVDADSVTVQLTPVGKYQSLYVISQTHLSVDVGGVEGEYNYTIYGTRKDVKPLTVDI